MIENPTTSSICRNIIPPISSESHNRKHKMRIALTANTTFHIDNVSGSDTTGDGLTPSTAFRSPQYARNFVYRNYDCNLYSAKFFYHNTGVIYNSDLICAYPLLGLPPDYGEMHEGELDSTGNVAVLVVGATSGCFHVAGGAQIYMKNFGVKGTGPAPCIIAPYDGFITVDHCVFYGSEFAPCFEAGPVQGRIAIDSSCWFIWTGPSNVFAGSAIFSAHDGGSITIPYKPGHQFSIYGNPTFGDCIMSVSNRGRIQCRTPFAGTARGVRWKAQSSGMILTGQNVNTYIPGDANGQNLDGTGVIL